MSQPVKNPFFTEKKDLREKLRASDDIEAGPSSAKRNRPTFSNRIERHEDTRGQKLRSVVVVANKGNLSPRKGWKKARSQQSRERYRANRRLSRQENARKRFGAAEVSGHPTVVVEPALGHTEEEEAAAEAQIDHVVVVEAPEVIIEEPTVEVPEAASVQVANNTNRAEPKATIDPATENYAYVLCNVRDYCRLDTLAEQWEVARWPERQAQIRVHRGRLNFEVNRDNPLSFELETPTAFTKEKGISTEEPLQSAPPGPAPDETPRASPGVTSVGEKLEEDQDVLILQPSNSDLNLESAADKFAKTKI